MIMQTFCARGRTIDEFNSRLVETFMSHYSQRIHYNDDLLFRYYSLVLVFSTIKM